MAHFLIDKPYKSVLPGLDNFRYYIFINTKAPNQLSALKARGSDITDVIVMPSDFSSVPFVPNKAEPEIEEYLLQEWGFTRKPLYVSPNMN